MVAHRRDDAPGIGHDSLSSERTDTLSTGIRRVWTRQRTVNAADWEKPDPYTALRAVGIVSGVAGEVASRLMSCAAGFPDRPACPGGLALAGRAPAPHHRWPLDGFGRRTGDLLHAGSARRAEIHERHGAPPPPLAPKGRQAGRSPRRFATGALTSGGITGGCRTVTGVRRCHRRLVGAPPQAVAFDGPRGRRIGARTNDSRCTTHHAQKLSIH